MENLRYLLAALAAVTLIMSVVSSINPGYFAGLNAFAADDDEEDDDNSGSSSNNDEEDDDSDETDEDEQKIVQTLGSNSKAALEIDDDAELQVEIEDGDLEDGTYDVLFSCDSPNVDKEFADALGVQDGEGEFEEDLPLANDTYSGCEVHVGDLSATFPSFTIAANEENDNDEEDDEEDDDDNNGRGHDDEDAEDDDNENHSARGSNEDDDDDEENHEDDDNSAKGSDNGGSNNDDKRKERKQRIVNSTSGAEIHKKHRGENAASSGDFRPGWNYTLEAEGEAMHTAHDGNLTQEANVTASVDMSVWKSNNAIILLDVVGGTVEVDGQDYDVRIGYAVYFVEHDALRVAALATNDDGDVFRLKLRGSAVDGSDSFPTQTGSIDLLFGGDVNDRFEDWNLLLEGTIEAN